MRCNDVLDCVDGTDEMECDSLRRSNMHVSVPPPATVHYLSPQERQDKERKTFEVREHQGAACPVGFFKCTEDGYCFELVFRCNGVDDCPEGEDELRCSDYQCPGLYRCRDSRICVLVQSLCDGFALCPQRDDELYCKLQCPKACACYGLAFKCSYVFAVQDFLEMRYLDASDSHLSLQQLSRNKPLVYLSLARCALDELGNVTLPNLHTLDLSDNHLREVTFKQLSSFKNLRTLVMSGNPLSSPFSATGDTSPLGLIVLDLSRVPLPVLSLGAHLPHLQRLNLSATGVQHLQEPGFQPLTSLRVLDVRGCPLSLFPRRLFHGLRQLRRVHSDTYRMCCHATLPAGKPGRRETDRQWERERERERESMCWRVKWKCLSVSACVHVCVCSYVCVCTRARIVCMCASE